jgi:hypothetical protein
MQIKEPISVKYHEQSINWNKKQLETVQEPKEQNLN